MARRCRAGMGGCWLRCPRGWEDRHSSPPLQPTHECPYPAALRAPPVRGERSPAGGGGLRGAGGSPGARAPSWERSGVGGDRPGRGGAGGWGWGGAGGCGGCRPRCRPPAPLPAPCRVGGGGPSPGAPSPRLCSPAPARPRDPGAPPALTHGSCAAGRAARWGAKGPGCVCHTAGRGGSSRSGTPSVRLSVCPALGPTVWAGSDPHVPFVAALTEAAENRGGLQSVLHLRVGLRRIHPLPR